MGVDEVSKDQSGASALSHDGLHENLTSLAQSFGDEPVRDSEVLLGVLARLIVELEVQVLK